MVFRRTLDNVQQTRLLKLPPPVIAIYWPLWVSWQTLTIFKTFQNTEILSPKAIWSFLPCPLCVPWVSGSSELEADSRPGLTLVLRLPWRLPASSEENSPDSGLAASRCWRSLGSLGTRAPAPSVIQPSLVSGRYRVKCECWVEFGETQSSLRKREGVEKLWSARLDCSRRRAQLSCLMWAVSSECWLTCTGTKMRTKDRDRLLRVWGGLHTNAWLSWTQLIIYFNVHLEFIQCSICNMTLSIGLSRKLLWNVTFLETFPCNGRNKNE